MLKIKDNVDLKILKKYGFEYLPDTNSYRMYEDGIDDADGLYVEANRRMHIGLDIDKLDVVLFQLIQDGLVEKVKPFTSCM